MGRPAGEERVELLHAGGPARDDSAVLGILGRELSFEFLANIDAELVVLGFVAEAAGHPAAFDVGGDDIVAEIVENSLRVRFKAEGALLTVAVVGDAFPVTRGECVGIATVLDEPVDVFERLVAVLAEWTISILGQELVILAVEHREIARFDDNDIAASVKVRFERINNIVGAEFRGGDHTLGEGGTTALSDVGDADMDIERFKDTDCGLPAFDLDVICIGVRVENCFTAGVHGRDSGAAFGEPLDESLTPEFREVPTAVNTEEVLHERTSGAGISNPVRDGRGRAPQFGERLEIAKEALLEVNAAGFLVRSEAFDEEVEIGLLVAVNTVSDDRVNPRNINVHRALVQTATTACTEVVELSGVMAVDSIFPPRGDST